MTIEAASEVADAKRALREIVRTERRARTQNERDRLAASLSAHAQSLVADCGASCIASFLPFRGEPDLTRFHSHAFDAGIRVLLPRTLSDDLTWVDASAADAIERGYGGVPQPTADAPAAHIDEATMIFAPAAAVDRSGARLGWGAGYYDRALAKIVPSVEVFAVIYDSEVVDAVPVLPHDRRVDAAITPSGILRFH